MNKRYLIIVLIFIAAACSTPKKTAIVKKQPADLGKAPDGYMYHQVLKGETIYGIAQKYNLSVADTKKLNAELGGIVKVGQVIKIPVAPQIAEPAKETGKAPGNTTNIALLLPFNANLGIDTTSSEEESEDRSSAKSIVAVEFYEGALMALDSLKKQGINVHMNVFDTQNDSLVIKYLLLKKELKESNIIIGPFANAQLATINNFSLLQHSILVSPLSSVASKLPAQNPYVNIAVPSVTVQCKQMAAFVADKFAKANIIVTHHAKGSSLEYGNIFRNVIAQKLSGKVTDINISDVGNKGVYNVLSPTQNNVIIVTSSNEAFVTELVTGLHARKDKYQLTLIGLPTWYDFETIDMDLLQDLNTHIFRACYVDEENTDVQQFKKRYAALYKAEPSSYVYQGFDVMYYYGKLVLKNNKKLIDNVPDLKLNTMHTNYNFESEAPGKGYENQYISVLKFEDYKLVKVNR